MKKPVRHPLYRLWEGMRRRCSYPGHASYRYYGAKGIRVCERWETSFAAFVDDMGPRPKGCSLDRYPNRAGNYEPGNCRWATIEQQNGNKGDTVLVDIDGAEKPLSVWARERGLVLQTVRLRMKRYGLTAQEALAIPVQQQGRRADWKTWALLAKFGGANADVPDSVLSAASALARALERTGAPA
jgi:hypothetical protein